MRLPSDNSLFEIDAKWLGPRNLALPFAVRYVAYVVGLVVFMALIVAERRLGVGMGLASVAWTLLWTVGITTQVMKLVDYERPFRTVLTTFRNELGAPRPAKATATTLSVPKFRPAPTRMSRPARLVDWCWRHTHRRPKARPEPPPVPVEPTGESRPSDPQPTRPDPARAVPLLALLATFAYLRRDRP